MKTSHIVDLIAYFSAVLADLMNEYEECSSNTLYEEIVETEATLRKLENEYMEGLQNG